MHSNGNVLYQRFLWMDFDTYGHSSQHLHHLISGERGSKVGELGEFKAIRSAQYAQASLARAAETGTNHHRTYRRTLFLLLGS